jgi:hypothetical protein
MKRSMAYRREPSGIRMGGTHVPIRKSEPSEKTQRKARNSPPSRHFSSGKEDHMYKKASQRQQEAARRPAYHPQSCSGDDGTLAGFVVFAVIGGVIWGTVKVVQGGLWIGKKLVRLATGTAEDSHRKT